MGTREVMVRGRRNQGCRGQQQHRRSAARGGGVERLSRMAKSSSEESSTEHKKKIADNRARNRRLDHVAKPAAESREPDDHFSGVAERHVQQCTNSRPGFFGEPLGRFPSFYRERGNRCRGRDKRPDAPSRRGPIHRNSDRYQCEKIFRSRRKPTAH